MLTPVQGLGLSKSLYATPLVLLGDKITFLQRKHKVLVALDDMSLHKCVFPVMAIPDTFADQTISKVC